MSAEVEAREPSARYLPAPPAGLAEYFDLLPSSSDGIAQLRDLVVTLAISGRLLRANVSADPEGAGPVLADMPFELPEGWRWATLGALQAEFQNGASSRGDVGGKLVTVVRLADIRSRRLSMADTRQVPIRTGDIDKYQLRDGDILITRVNGSAEIVGRFNLVDGDPQAIYCDHFIRMRVRRDTIDPRFLALFGDSEVIRSRIRKLFITTAGQKTVNQGHISSLPIAIPPLAEQARIVARVDELMRLCDALEAKGRLEAEQHARLLSTLLGTLTDSTTPEELAANWQRVAEHFDLLLDRPEAVDVLEQTILQLAARGLLVPQRAGDEPDIRGESALPVNEQLFDAPSTWSWVRIDQIAEVQGGIQKTPARRPVKSHVPYLRVANVQRGALDLRDIERFEVTAEESERWGLRAGDLLIVEGNGSEHEIGRSAIWTGDIEPCVYQNHLIRVRCHHPGATIFLQLFLNSPDGKSEMKRLAITTSGLYNLSVGKVRRFAIALPPITEQARIVARVTELRRLCADLRQRLAAAQATQSHLADALVEQALA